MEKMEEVRFLTTDSIKIEQNEFNNKMNTIEEMFYEIPPITRTYGSLLFSASILCVSRSGRVIMSVR